MRKIVNFFLISFSLLFLVSCKTESRSLYGPKGLTYDQESLVLVWNEIKDAQAYKLVINEEETIELINNYYSFEDYPIGSYRVKVKAIFKDGETLYSNTYTFIVKEEFELKIYSDGTYIYWDDLAAANYKIKYREDYLPKTHSLIENKFKIPETLKSKATKINLEVYFNGAVIYETSLLLSFNVTRVFYEEGYQIEIQGAQAIYIDGELIEEGFIAASNTLTLKQELIRNYQQQIFISIVGEENAFYLLHLMDLPFLLISPPKQSFIGEDINFEFDLRGYEIIKVNGLTINEDYLIENNILTIKKEYIQNIMETKKEKISIELHVTLSKGISFTEVVYLIISLKS